MQFRKLYVGGKKIYFLRQKFFIESKTDIARQALNLVSEELRWVIVSDKFITTILRNVYVFGDSLLINI